MPMSIVLRDLSASFLYGVAAIYGPFNLVGLAGFPFLLLVLVPGEQLDQANALEGVSYALASLSGATLTIATAGAGRRLRRRYRGSGSYTDCNSFDANPGPSRDAHLFVAMTAGGTPQNV